MSIRLVYFLIVAYNIEALQLTPLPSQPTLGDEFSLTCTSSLNAINFGFDTVTVCIVTRVNSDGSCNTSACNTSFSYTCNATTYTMTIPGSFNIDMYHGTTWYCQDILGGQNPSNKVVLNVIVPINSVILTSSATSIPVDNDRNITCTTDAGRPNARIQWYLSDGYNLTALSSQQPECGTSCNKVVSRSVLVYTGKLVDHGKAIYCTASNVHGKSMRSSDFNLTISYGPSSVELDPSTRSYTVKEGGSVKSITCRADCRPICKITWSGPNLPGGTTSELNLQNIDRNQTGEYRCIANNSVGSQTSVNVTINVKYGPRSVEFYPSTLSYTVTEGGSINGSIICTADCSPNCTLAWYGPNVPGGTTSVLTLQNINRNQAGYYRCEANNSVGYLTSSEVNVIVNYGPSAVTFTPTNQTYTVTEETIGSVGPINCIADCRPICTMTWSGPNLPSNTTSVLDLQNINRNQAGIYKCNASNSVGSSMSGTVAVTVNYVPTIKNIDGNRTYTENDTAKFQCQVDSIPKSTITWTFIDGNNITILSNENELVFKVNDSLLTVYQMNCLSMGQYVCEAKNSIGGANKTLNIKVMCAPKLNTIEYRIPERIAVMDNQPLNITAPVLAYPKPSFYWQFIQNNSVSNITNTFQSTYNLNRHFSILYIENMTEDSFGTYAIFAANGIEKNSNYIGEFVVQAARRPNKPSHLNCSAGYNYIIVNWQPEFNGGSQQSFRIIYKEIKTEPFINHHDNVSETKYHPVKIENLRSSSVYLLKVHAVNTYNITESDEIKCNTTKEELNKAKSIIAVGVGTGVGAAVVLIISMTTGIFFFRRLKLKKTKNDKEPMKRINEEDENDDLKDNPLYIASADDLGSHGPFYGKVSKQKKQGKGNKSVEMACVYENPDDIMKGNEQIYANHRDTEKTTTEYKPTKNKDGLIYADLDLVPVSEGQKFVIHGMDNRNNYAIIDLSKKADPLTDDDGEEKDSDDRKK